MWNIYSFQGISICPIHHTPNMNMHFAPCLHIDTAQVMDLPVAWCLSRYHDDVIKWKHFPRYRPFVRGIHRSPVNSPHKGQWRGTLTFPLICAWINRWVNNSETGDQRRHRALYDVTVIMVRWGPWGGWLWMGGNLGLSWNSLCLLSLEEDQHFGSTNIKKSFMPGITFESQHLNQWKKSYRFKFWIEILGQI